MFLTTNFFFFLIQRYWSSQWPRDLRVAGQHEGPLEVHGPEVRVDPLRCFSGQPRTGGESLGVCVGGGLLLETDESEAPRVEGVGENLQ